MAATMFLLVAAWGVLAPVFHKPLEVAIIAFDRKSDHSLKVVWPVRACGLILHLVLESPIVLSFEGIIVPVCFAQVLLKFRRIRGCRPFLFQVLDIPFGRSILVNVSEHLVDFGLESQV